MHLYISVNQGRDWEVYAREPGPQGKFDFRAPREGPYWFCSRTMDNQKQLWPKGEKHPELIIIVDVTQPKLQLLGTEQPDGRILLQWQVQDTRLQPDSFQLSSQADGDPQWASIHTPPLTPGSSPGSYRGETLWQPQRVSPVFTVQATVSDQAGNRAVVRRQITVTESLTTKPPVTKPKSPAKNPSALAIPDPDRQPAPPQKKQLPAIPWPPENKTPTQPPLADTTQDNSQADGSSHPATNPLPGSSFNPIPTDNGQPASPPGGRATSSQRVTVSPSIPTVPDQSPFESQGPVPPTDRSTTATALFADNTVQLPPGTIVRSSNSRYFQLEYELQETEKEEPREIQLWATADGGRTWKHWGNDEDRQSPFQVQVRYEGIFGFRIAVVGKNGLTGRQPTQGDPADIWLRVDTTPPQTRIQSATFGTGNQSGNLVIRWQVEDLALADRPIKLSYRENPDDQWTTIASGLPHRGTYAWPVSPGVPNSIYLRLDAEDLAGNTGTYQHPTPVTLDGLAPQGRIRAVQPLPSPGPRPTP